jgi:asparagine synthase (glutamine-hydrolysing)
MCGVVGIVPLDGHATPEREILQRMVAAIRHRGPDDEGYYVASGVGLGHARLSIIDVQGGRQPIHNEDKSIWITYNGEIFNYIELRQDLETRGHRFYTETDTEVIVHMYEEYGDEFVHQLNGQFAIALWDQNRRRQLLVRDRVGILPLFYSVTADCLLFSSEIKGLLASGQIKPTLDHETLDQLLTFWCPVAPKTMFTGVSQVKPGEMLVLSNGQIVRHQYWDWNFPTDGQFSQKNDQDLADELEALLEDATRIRLRADVPVGAYLSGGLDSSSLVALINKQKISKLRTFSIGFENAGFDETDFQRELSDHLCTDHSSIHCGEEDIASLFVRSIWHAEAPILRTAPIPMNMLSSLVRQSDFKVVLTGEGADEVLGGYDIFKEAKVREFWSRNPASEWRPALLQRLYPYLDISGSKSKTYLRTFFGSNLGDVNHLTFAHMPRWNMTSQIKMFYSQEFKDSLQQGAAENFERQAAKSWPDWHRFNRWEYVEAKTILPGYILSSQGDRMLMANSVEGRFPFLDHRVIEFARMMPPKLKMRAMREKYLLKKAMQKHVPDSITKRTKQPYRAPNAEVFTSDKAFSGIADLLSAESLSRAGYFDPKKVTHLINKARRSSSLGERDNMAFVGILSTQVWHHLFVERVGSAYQHDT